MSSLDLLLCLDGCCHPPLKGPGEDYLLSRKQNPLCSHTWICRIVSLCLFYSSKWGFPQEISFPSNGKKYRSTLAVQKLAVPYKQDWGNKAAATQSLGTECTPAIVIGRCNGDLTPNCWLSVAGMDWVRFLLEARIIIAQAKALPLSLECVCVCTCKHTYIYTCCEGLKHKCPAYSLAFGYLVHS